LPLFAGGNTRFFGFGGFSFFLGGFFGIRRYLHAADATKAIAVFKPPICREGAVPIDELQHFFLEVPTAHPDTKNGDLRALRAKIAFQRQGR
jgi:hypothetical protein